MLCCHIPVSSVGPAVDTRWRQGYGCELVLRALTRDTSGSEPMLAGADDGKRITRRHVVEIECGRVRRTRDARVESRYEYVFLS